MEKIYVVGHKNPDTDSLCAAYCYAELKNAINTDAKVQYKAVRCGTVNPQSNFVFKEFGIEPPPLRKDVYIRAYDIMISNTETLSEDDPTFIAMKKIAKNKVVIPIISETNSLRGTINADDMSNFLLHTYSIDKKQEFVLTRKNINAILPGKIFKRGKNEEFIAPIILGSVLFRSSYDAHSFDNKPALICSFQDNIIKEAVDLQLPAIIITFMDDEAKLKELLKNYKGFVYLSSIDIAETLRRVEMSTAIKYVMNPSPTTIESQSFYDDIKKRLLETGRSSLIVTHKNKYMGIISRRQVIEKPAKKIILVDHNELKQSIDGAQDAEVQEIIDHHRFAPQPTANPIYIYSKALGSTCSLVYLHYKNAKVNISKKIAKVLLSGIFSDTLLLKSPTTTEEDKTIAQDLMRISDLSLQDYGKKLLSANPSLTESDPREAITRDMKPYTVNEMDFAIGQIEVMNFSDLNESYDVYREMLYKVKLEQDLTFLALMITDVLESNSYLLITPIDALEENLSYNQTRSNLYFLPGIISRKKQLLPEILWILNEIA